MSRDIGSVSYKPKITTMITSYFIDNEGTMHTFIGEQKHITFSNVDSIYHAEMLIEEENRRLLIESFNLTNL